MSHVVGVLPRTRTDRFGGRGFAGRLQWSTDRKRPWRWPIIGAGAVAAAVMLSGNHAAAVPLIDITVTGDAGAATDVVDLEGSTYAAAVAALNAASTSPGSATIPVDLTGLDAITSNDASLTYDDTTRTIALRGAATVRGASAELLVTSTWDSAADVDPDVAVLTRFSSVSLSTLNPGWTGASVTFGPALLGLTDVTHAVAPSATLGTTAFFNDGVAATDDTFSLTGGAVNLQAIISGGDLAEATSELGGTATGVRIRGALSTSFDVLDPAASTGAGLDLSVDIPVTTPSSFPEWVELSSPWTLSLAADTGGSFVASFSGGAEISPDGGTPISVTGTATVSIVDSAPSLALQLDVGAIDDLFGQTWLDLQGASVGATIAAGSFEGGIEATLTVGEATGTVSMGLAVSNGDISATLDLDVTGPVSATSMLTAMGAPTTDIDESMIDLTLNQITLHVSVDKPSGDTASVVASVFADSTLSINDADIDTQILFRGEFGGASPVLLVAGRLDAPNLTDLVPTIPFDWELPDIALLASNTDVSTPYADLDAPTQNFFAPVLCDADGNCSDLEATQGLTIEATIELPADLADQLENIGITVDGPLRVTGTLPVLGGTTTSLAVSLPTISGDASSLVKEGTVSFSIAYLQAESRFEASIDGNMVFRVSRASDAECDGSEDGTWPSSTSCYDELDLTVSAEISVSPTGGAKIALSGTINDWDNAFGLDWLEIQTLTLQLSLEAGGDSAVSLGIGFLGQFVIGSGTETTDLTFAIKAEITPTPPWITITGLTAASYDGVSLRQVAQTFDPTLDTDSLPDISLKNLFFAYGTATDVDLCIRQGLYISAELHLGAPTSTGADPQCVPGETIPEDPADLPTAGCSDSDTCLAAILLDVTTSPSPSLTAAGFIRGFDAGPLHIEDTEVVIQVSATQQRFYLSGGVTITDITGATDDEWASGSATIDFQNDRGAVSLEIEAFVNLGGDEGLTAEVTGSIAIDFSTLGSLDIEALIDSLDFDLDVELSFPALVDLGEDIQEAFVPVEEWLDDTGDDITDAFDGTTGNTDWDSFVAHFQGIPSIELDYLEGYSGSQDVTASYIEAVVRAHESYIKDYWQLWFYDVTFADGSTMPAQNYYIQVIGDRAEYYVNYYGIEYITLNGIDVQLLAETDVGLETITERRLTVPSGCNPNFQIFWGLVGNPVCDGGLDNLAAEAGAPLAGELFTAETGYTLPVDGATGARVASFAAAATLDPPDDEIEAIERLNAAFLGEGVTAECATITLSHAVDGTTTQSPATVLLDAFGTPVSIEAGFNDGKPKQPILPSEVVQTSIDTILQATAPAEACNAPVVPVGPGGTTLTLSTKDAVEGTPMSASGVADPGYLGATITVTWGDGTTSTTTASSTDGTWTVSHTYADDPGSGQLTNYVVAAAAAGTTDQAYARLTVSNVVPSWSALTLTPSVTEGGTATLTGTFADPGTLDSHVVVVNWGDGTQSSQTFAAGAPRSFTLTHVYQDDNPTRTPSDVVRVTATITDKDGGTHTSDRTIRVDNVAPTTLQIDTIKVGQLFAATGADGRAIVPEGATVTYTGSFRDVGLSDTQSVGVDWGDGTPVVNVAPTRDAVDPALWRFTATHVYVDDDPTATASDVYTIQLRAADDDTGLVSATRSVRVENVAAQSLKINRVSLGSSTAPVDADGRSVVPEGATGTYTGSFNDPGVRDTQSVTIDWGDGTAMTTLTPTRDATDPTLWHFTADHVYVDDDPTATISDLYTITVRASDDDTGVTQSTHVVRVADVAPVVNVPPIDDTTENVGITMVADFTDVGVRDTHTAVVDWGDGTLPEALTVSQRAGGGSVTADHVYGDNGTFTVTVTVTDDDNVVSSASTTVTVDNTDPTATIDLSGATVLDGIPTLIGTQDVTVPLRGSVTDPGSDDLTVTWTFGDGSSATTLDLVNPPNPDPQPSASVQPRSISTPNDHAYARPCTYVATLDASDDDGGVAMQQSVNLVVLASDHRWEALGFWKNQYGGLPTIDAADLACYLQMVSAMSSVFGDDDPIPMATYADASLWLFKNGNKPIDQLDRELLFVWLNVANGGLPLLTPLDTDRNGVPDKTALAVLQDAERVRLDPNSNSTALKLALDSVRDLARFGR